MDVVSIKPVTPEEGKMSGVAVVLAPAEDGIISVIPADGPFEAFFGRELPGGGEVVVAMGAEFGLLSGRLFVGLDTSECIDLVNENQSIRKLLAKPENSHTMSMGVLHPSFQGYRSRLWDLLTLVQMRQYPRSF